MITHQTRKIGNLNRLRTLQQQVSFWEKSTEHYKKTLSVFQEYLDCLRDFDDQRAIINTYIRMASYCEHMEDPLLSRELLKEAKERMEFFNLGESNQLQKMQKKIDALHNYS